jgi:hypothetical protein
MFHICLYFVAINAVNAVVNNSARLSGPNDPLILQAQENINNLPNSSSIKAELQERLDAVIG